MLWTRIAGSAYWTCFVAVFVITAIWETHQAKRKLSVPAERRWRNHAALLVLSIGASLVLRGTPIGLASALADSPLGLLNRAWAPLVVRCIIALVVFDLLQYGIHWSFHRVGWLWRIHQVHHSDPDFDVSTAGRFHPFEVVLTEGAHLAATALLVPPVAAVFAYSLLTVVLNLSAHANASFPWRIEKMLRRVFITPDLHRIHHSREMLDQQRNLGQTFPWWDRIFGTFSASAKGDEGDFQTGLSGLGGQDCLGLGFMLAEPFLTLKDRESEIVSDSLT